MRRCGLAITVPEASEDVRRRAHLVTSAGGGRGAAREACEFIMRAQGTWAGQLARYDR
jgi:3-deoxy-D-manno-octulosonate 8-phosphate phosphatase (KDO 8-P phosphatase)